MTAISNVELTITFIDPDLTNEEKDEEVKKLLTQIKELDEVEEVHQVLDPSPPQGHKSLTGWLVGKLIAVVKSEQIKQVLGFFTTHLVNKTIEVEAEANGKKIKVKASSISELEAAVKTIEEFVTKK